MMLQPLEVAALAFSVALLVALGVAMAYCWRWLRYKRMLAQQIESNSVSMQEVPLWALRDRPSTSGGSPATVLSDEPTQLEVVDFSKLTMGRPIGKGGFATVWTARWQGNNLAVKVLNMEQETIDESAAHQEVAMLQEVAILRRLRHPCICTLFGHMRVGQRPALVLEYMAGGSLAAYLFNKSSSSTGEHVQASVSSLNAALRRLMSVVRSPSNPSPSPLTMPPTRPHLVDKKICFAVQLASGLCFLHSHGILHCDVKAENALLDVTHTMCKLADFGLASLKMNCARPGMVVGGTLRYLAPERVKEALSYKPKSCDRGDGRGSSSGSLSLGRTLVNFEDRVDVYAFAFLLWELTHERRAFEGMTGADAAFSASQGLRPHFSEPSHRHGIMIRALTVECWAWRPEDRPSMSTVLERLEACMQALSATQSVGDSSVQSSTQPTLPSCSTSDESPTAAAVLFDNTYIIEESARAGCHVCKGAFSAKSI